ncbi:meromycolate extension acyl carrier protein AcpM [Nocardia sp. NPDC005978]|uniref:meromycolate extension acyl carrier protein AcpM n=1 Tax=unclassified Nocardia TaxID=2637762 RepID=UPI0033A74800
MATTREEIIAGIAEIVEEVTGIEAAGISIEQSFVADLEIDSLSLVEIAVQLEDKYGVSIPDEDMASLRSVGDAVAYVERMAVARPELAARLASKLERGQGD